MTQISSSNPCKTFPKRLLPKYALYKTHSIQVEKRMSPNFRPVHFEEQRHILAKKLSLNNQTLFRENSSPKEFRRTAFGEILSAFS